MSKPALLNTSTINFRTLMSNGKRYDVPPYQRDYSWGEEQWEDLWLDLEALETDERQHYMGTLVLQEEATDQFKIIDGQQRLATLSILVVASLHCLNKLIDSEVEPDENGQRSDLLRSAFLGSKSPVTLKTAAKLTLNQANRRFYEGTLLDLRRPASITTLPPTEKPLWKAMEYFRDKLEEKFVSSEDGAGLANFIYEVTSTRLLFIQVVVEDEVGAYTVFETLNARGLELTAGDLLKNYLLSMVHPAGQGDLEHAQRQWHGIAEKVEPRKLSVFLRHYLNSRRDFVRQERVFKTLRTEITKPNEVFELLDDLEGAALLNEALDDPTSPLWDEFSDAYEAVRHLKLYQVAQYRPLAFAVWRRLTPADLAKVLGYCDVISFRYNIISQRNTNKLEQVYNTVAIQVENRELASAIDIKHALQPIYVSDDEFREQFAKRSMSAARARKKLVRYILCALEKQMHNADFDFETTRATIEHILPESPTPEWRQEFPDDVHERYVSRLGNYLLLEAKLNRNQAANRDLTSKQAVYAASQYPSTRDFDWVAWNPRTIDERQARMAKAATAVWRLP